MKFLVIGARGFIGAHVCRELVAQGHEVTALDRATVSNLHSDVLPSLVREVTGDFLNPMDLSGALFGAEVVIHLASTTTPETSNLNPRFDVETNLMGALQLVDVARQHKIKKIVFASSGGTVYGLPEKTPVAEDHPTNPICAYGITKLAIEKFLQLNFKLHDMDYTVLRVSNPYGEGQSPYSRQGAVAVFTHKALTNETIDIWGDGSIIRDYVHVSDVAKAFVQAGLYSGESHIFNIGSGEGRSLRDIVEALQQALARPVAHQYSAGRAFDVPISILDISRAKNELGWHPAVGFTEGIHRNLRWQEQFLQLHHQSRSR